MTRRKATSVCSQSKIVDTSVKWRWIGHFQVPSNLEIDQKLRLLEIIPFWSQERLKRILLPIILNQSVLSRRAINWLATNYSKKHDSLVLVTDPSQPESGRELMINIFEHYNCWQSHYKRALFDVFKRKGGGILNIRVDMREYATSVAQLNFFFWFERYGIMNFALTHVDAINQDMAKTNLEAEERNKLELLKPPHKRKKRHELSQRPPAKCQVVRYTLELDFRPGRE